MDELSLAYYAGLLDGEGHIGIHRTVRKRDQGVQYGGRMSLRMSEREVIEQFAEDFGLSAGPANCGTRHAKREVFGVSAEGRRSRVLLEQLLPYLRVKRAQAELVIRLEAEKREPGLRSRKIPTSRLMPGGVVVRSTASAIGPETIARWEAMYVEVRKLNRPEHEIAPRPAG